MYPPPRRAPVPTIVMSDATTPTSPPPPPPPPPSSSQQQQQHEYQQQPTPSAPAAPQTQQSETHRQQQQQVHITSNPVVQHGHAQSHHYDEFYDDTYQVVPTSGGGNNHTWGSEQVVDTEVSYASKKGAVKMKKIRSIERALKNAAGSTHLRTNGFHPGGQGGGSRRRQGGGDSGSGMEKEPLLSNGAFSIGVIGEEVAESGIGLCGFLLTAISWLLVVVTLPFSLCVCFKVVQEYERAVIFRLGRLLSGGSRGPGIFFVLPCIESYQKVDLRTITLGVPPQEVLTKDSVTVSVDAVVYYRVSNATVSVANVENAHHSTRLLAQTTLRNILGTKNLHEILSDRESISGSMQCALDDATEPWGIKVERVEIKDVRLPVQLQRAMAAEAEAAREARAKVIAAEGEQKASRALREASEVIANTPAALQLRYLQTLNTISAEKNSTIVFPLPIDILSHLMKPKAE